jgi:hypothetical protein
LATWVDHEDHNLFSVSKKLQNFQPTLAHSVFTRCQHVNNVHYACLSAVYCLDGYSEPIPIRSNYSKDSDVTADLDSPVVVEVNEDDALNDELTCLTECLDNMTT